MKVEKRQQYNLGQINDGQLDPNPFVVFKEWFSFVNKDEFREPEAMSLATVDGNGAPSLRTVLLKEFGEDGFVFYTNYRSKKGSDLEVNNKVALLFYWDVLERQVRIRGYAERLPRDKSEHYFSTRPHGAQVSAISSMQSNEIASREQLENAMKVNEEKYKEADITCPEHWGGYRVTPNYFEFWQGRPDRLHDRLAYFKEDYGWRLVRLQP